MGIQSLNNLLRKVCPNVFEPIHLSEYAYKKVAIDTSLFLCKYKAIKGDRWLEEFIRLVSCLRKNEIHCVFIYDNGAPPEKDDEKARRRAQSDKNKQRVSEIDEAIKIFYATDIINETLQTFFNEIKAKPAQKRLLASMNKLEKDVKFDIHIVLERLEKMRSNILNISAEDYKLTEELFKILNIPFYMAELEAETTCADLCKRGIVDAVLSEDTDVLAYGCPTFLTKFRTDTESCTRIYHEEVLNCLELTDDEFLDVCIMCGCDYNKRIAGLGPANAYTLIKKHGSIEKVGEDGIFKKTKIDITSLNHTRTRELFKNYKKMEINSVPFCGSPDFPRLVEFVKIHNIHVDIEKLKKNFTHNNIIIIEEDDEDEIEEKEDETIDENEEEVEVEIEIEE